MLPEAVRRQRDAANAAIQQPTKPAGTTDPIVPTGDAKAPVVDIKTGQAPDESARLRLELANAVTVSQRAEQRYVVLKGKYDAEVPRMAAEIRDLKAQIAARPAGTPDAGEGLHIDGESDLVRTYGEGIIDVIKKAVDAGVKHRIGDKPPASEPARTEAQARSEDDDVPTADMVADYHRLLDQQVPDWKTQNDDAGFIAWLNGKDPYSRVSRLSMLQHHHQKLDALKVAEIFLAYTQNREIGSRNDHLEIHAAPPAGDGDGAPKGADGKKGWTTAEINQFYKDCALGKYKGLKEDRDRIEQDIFAAQREGRVRPG